MGLKRTLLAIGLVGVAGEASAQGATGITVFLDRGGMTVERSWVGGGEAIAIPRFGGTARTWTGVVACVREKFAAFDVEVVDERPGGEFITAVVGGQAEQLGFDGRRVAGVGVTDVVVTRDAVVHVFSKSIGESDARQLCNVAAHEIGHAMGLDHSTQCGDIMSYPRQECGFGLEETFVDADAQCGEYEARECHTGSETQNSYRRLGMLVGLRNPAEPEPEAAANVPPNQAPAKEPAELDGANPFDEAPTTVPAQPDGAHPFEESPTAEPAPDGANPFEEAPTPQPAIEVGAPSFNNETPTTAEPALEPMTSSCGGRRHQRTRWRRQRAGL